jgi:hypothetical protein
MIDSVRLPRDVSEFNFSFGYRLDSFWQGIKRKFRCAHYMFSIIPIRLDHLSIVPMNYIVAKTTRQRYSRKLFHINPRYISSESGMSLYLLPFVYYCRLVL